MKTVQLFDAVRFVHKAYHTSRTTAKIRLRTTKVFLKKFPTVVLTNCVGGVDGGYTDAEVGKLRDIESYQIKPEMDEIPAKMAKPKEGLESGVRVDNGRFFWLFTNNYFKSNQSF